LAYLSRIIQTRDAHIFQTSNSHLKILGARRVNEVNSILRPHKYLVPTYEISTPWHPVLLNFSQNKTVSYRVHKTQIQEYSRHNYTL